MLRDQHEETQNTKLVANTVKHEVDAKHVEKAHEVDAKHEVESEDTCGCEAHCRAHNVIQIRRGNTKYLQRYTDIFARKRHNHGS